MDNQQHQLVHSVNNSFFLYDLHYKHWNCSLCSSLHYPVNTFFIIVSFNLLLFFLAISPYDLFSVFVLFLIFFTFFIGLKSATSCSVPCAELA